MSAYTRTIRRSVSLTTAFLLFLQLTFSQDRFQPVSDWVNTNLPDLGGRAVLLIWKDGQLVYNQAFNNLSKRQQTAGKIRARVQGKEEEEVLQDYTSTTRERIASASKWLSAALVLTFVDEGKLRLSDTVGKFLPSLSKYGKGHIRIWHCLSHTTGIKEGGLRETIGNLQKITTMDAYIDQLLTAPMEGEPGKVFRYGNTGLQLAAAVIEKISGKDFETLFRERIADPLEMKNTDFGKSGLPLAAGGAWSTPEDYLNFLLMIRNEGMFRERRILSKAMVHEMQKNKIGRDCLIAQSPDEAG
ncbi:MAG TPA: serine hydrolase domain-containing protein, partial [Lacibacter sp.]|nr:serine hydrolase domain-containing protein [Lacibacter sp.]